MSRDYKSTMVVKRLMAAKHTSTLVVNFKTVTVDFQRGDLQNVTVPLALRERLKSSRLALAL